MNARSSRVYKFRYHSQLLVNSLYVEAADSYHRTIITFSSFPCVTKIRDYERSRSIRVAARIRWSKDCRSEERCIDAGKQNCSQLRPHFLYDTRVLENVIKVDAPSNTAPRGCSSAYTIDPEGVRRVCPDPMSRISLNNYAISAPGTRMKSMITTPSNLPTEVYRITSGSFVNN